ncbi:hypothetical protein ANN_10325 [Periplaneta americana]|uniref:RIIa domain-containing protein n=1 Tax=Periplaneta americana TaxID=6978 RepID=A0ABQ8TRH5_PERAM|nr:hypothetical protein ANN_10325 [Periplaneta americana]
MSPGSSTENYPAFAHIGLRENPGKNLNQSLTMSLTSKGPLFLRVSVPEGMDAALEGLTREVLKQQPRDIYWFAAEHFEKLVQLRDMGGESITIDLALLLSENLKKYNPCPILFNELPNEEIDKCIRSMPESEKTTTGACYLDMLTEFLQPQLEQDGIVDAPCHYATTVSDYLNEVFPNRWIGRGGVDMGSKIPRPYPIRLFLYGDLLNPRSTQEKYLTLMN